MAMNRLGFALALAGAFLYSTKPIFIKLLYAEGVASIPMLWLRMLVVIPIYLVIGVIAWRRLEHKPSGRQLLEAMGVGILGYYFASLFDLLGLQYIGAQLERLILYAYPSIVVLLGLLLFRKPLTRYHLMAMVLTYAGLAVVYGHDLQLPQVAPEQLHKGVALVFTSALFFACYILFSRRSIEVLGSVLFTSVAMAAAASVTMIHFMLDGSAQVPAITLPVAILILALALLATVVPSFLISAAIKRIGPANTSLSGTLGPAMTTVLAILVLNEPFGWQTALGIGLVVAGVYLLQRAKT